MLRMGLVLVVSLASLGWETASGQTDDEGATTSIQSIAENLDFAGNDTETRSDRDHSHPDWTSVLPPLLAIALALVVRHVLLALTFGVWLGSFLLTGLSPVSSFTRLLDTHIVGAMADPGHASILIFSMLLGGMLGLIVQSGGARGLASWVRTTRGGRRRAQLSTWFAGLLIFFDDYANSLLVGASMRPVTDRLRISREKLAFLVDATAAPVASLALISSWIAVEVGYIEDQFSHLGIARDAYVTFIETIPYRFYPILMLFFVAWVAIRGRDFGPMWHAERRAAVEGRVLREGARPASDFHDEAIPDDVVGRPMNALVPVTVVVAVAAVGMYFADASSSSALLWASGVGCLAAFGMALASRALRLQQAMDAWLSGMRGMLLAVLILVLAWALGGVCRDLGTADFLVGVVGGWLTPMWIPTTVFVLSALVSFATGTSWGTMAILFPLVVPLAHELAPQDTAILFGTISSILAGSVWGDHCSPLSDTTILSSMATSCDHMDHVRTQLPYALSVGAVSVLCAELPVAAGWYGPWVGLAVGAAVMIAAFELVSRPVPP